MNLAEEQTTNICNECGSAYYAHASAMAGLCPECAHYLYGYENCGHTFISGRCSKCYWDGSTTAYVQQLKNS